MLRLATEAPAICSRVQLYICFAITDRVREICDEAGEVDPKMRDLCIPILRIGQRAQGIMAGLALTPDMVSADFAIVAVRPVPPDRHPHPLAAELGPPLRVLDDYLRRNLGRLEDLIEERIAEREAAGEGDPVYRSLLFQPDRPPCNP